MPPKSTTPRYVVTVEGNLQGRQRTVHLGMRTLLLAKNAGGKDAVIRTLTLALRGTADDIDGKDDVAQTALLAELMPEGVDVLTAKAVDDRGEAATFKLTRTEAGTLKSEHAAFASTATFVLADMMQMWDTTDTKGRRRWLMDVAGRALAHEAVVAMYPEPLRFEYEAIAKAVKQGVDTNVSASELLVLVRTEVNRRKLEASRTADAQSKAADAVASVPGDRLAVTDADVEAAKLAVERAEYHLGSLPPVTATVVVAPPVPVPKLTEADYASWNQVVQEVTQAQALEAQIQGWLAANPRPDDTALAPLRQQVDQWAAFLDTSRKVQDLAQQGVLGACPCCAAKLDAAQLHYAGQQSAGVEAWIQQQVNGALRAPMQWASAMNELGRVQEQTARLIATEQRYRRLYDEQAAEAAAYSAYFERSQETAELEAAQAREAAMVRALAIEAVRQAREAHTRLVTARTQAQSSERARAQAHAATVDRDRYTRLLAATDKVIESALGRLQQSFVDAVRKHMPAEDQMPEGGVFDVTLVQNGKETVRMGLRRAGMVHTALSGAERMIVFTAIAAALTDIWGLDFAVVVPPDRAVRADVLKTMMRALAKCRCQIVMANVVNPGKVAGWKVVDLDAGPVVGSGADDDGGDKDAGAKEGSKDGASTPSADQVQANLQAKALAEQAAEEAAALVRDEGGTEAEAKEAAAAAMAQVVAEVQAASVKSAALPAWATSELPRCRGTLPTKGFGAELLKVAGAELAGRFASEAAGDVVEIEVNGAKETWRRYPCGIITRSVGSRTFVHWDDATVEATKAGPLWALGEARGPLLGTSPAGSLMSAYRSIFGPTASVVPVETVKMGDGRVWSRCDTGAVLWRDQDEVSIYAGTSGRRVEVEVVHRTDVGSDKVVSSEWSVG